MGALFPGYSISQKDTTWRTFDSFYKGYKTEKSEVRHALAARQQPPYVFAD